MNIGGVYSFNNGNNELKQYHRAELLEVINIIKSVDASEHKNKSSEEKTMRDKMLYSPIGLNVAFKTGFEMRGWESHRENCNYSKDYYIQGYDYPREFINAYREMDFVKNKVGVEVQFGKYAFMVYNVAAKMTIFRNLGVIDVGIEIVPLKELAEQMSTGVSYFEQFVWDLENRGEADIDIPVLILGVYP